MGTDRQGAAFVGGRHKPEQQLGAGVIERGESDLVDLCRHRDRSTYPDLATMPILRRRVWGALGSDALIGSRLSDCSA